MLLPWQLETRCLELGRVQAAGRPSPHPPGPLPRTSRGGVRSSRGGRWSSCYSGRSRSRQDGRGIPIGGAKQRALLALLLLHANEVVSRDRLIGELWGERPPGTAEHSLDHQISRLRKLLEPSDLLVTKAGGYVLAA